MEADVGLILDGLKELLGPGLPELLVVGKGDEELHRLAALRITGMLVEGGNVVVDADELRDSDSVCEEFLGRVFFREVLRGNFGLNFLLKHSLFSNFD